MLVLGITAIFLTTVLLAGTDDFVVLFLLQFIAGVGAIAMRLSGQTWIARTTEVDGAGSVAVGHGWAAAFRAFVGPVIAGLLIDRFGYTVTFAVAGRPPASACSPSLPPAIARLHRWPGTAFPSGR